MAKSLDGYKKGRLPSKASSEFRDVAIYRARVVDVNIRDFTVDTRMEASPYTNKFDIPFLSPYCGQSQGEGINFMPEVGSICWVCEPSEEGRESFVLGWSMVDEGGSYRGGRSLLNPGDIELKTRDQNFVILRRGGIVQIGSTPVCQRVFLPIRNIMQDFAENYELHTPGGDLTWNVMRKDEDSDGHQKCLFQIAAKEFADDGNEKTVALLKIGSHGDGDNTILTLQTRDKGGGAVKINLTFDKSGTVSWTMQKDMNLQIKGDFSKKVDGTSSNYTKGDVSEKTDSNYALEAKQNASFKAKNQVNIEGLAKTIIKGGQVEIDEALFPVVRASPDFIAWIAAVTAQLAAGSAPFGVQANPTITTLIPKKYQNPKVTV